MYLKMYFHLSCNSFEVYEMTVPICTHMSLVFGEFLAQGLHLKSQYFKLPKSNSQTFH